MRESRLAVTRAEAVVRDDLLLFLAELGLLGSEVVERRKARPREHCCEQAASAPRGQGSVTCSVTERQARARGRLLRLLRAPVPTRPKPF